MIRARLLVACALASSPAFAQVGTQAPGDAPVAPIDPVPPEPPPPAPPPTPPQPPQPPVLTPQVTQPAEAAPDSKRPDGFSIGIGVGYRFPTSLSIPNAASVRFRLPSGITFEPSVVLASSSQEVDVGMSTGGSATEVGVGAVARFSLVGRRRTDLELLATANVDRVNVDPSDQNPDDNTTTSSVSLGYGLAVGLWITQNLQVSLSATNALVNYVHEREEMGFDFVQVTNTTTFGLIFDPTVTLMVHLYN